MQPVQDQFKALGSEALITLVANKNQAEPWLGPLKRTIAEFESQFSRFLPDSELTHVNQTAGARTSISPAFAALLQAALEWSRHTGGLYNPLTLPALQTAGYIGSWPHPETGAPVTNFADRRLADPAEIQLGPDWVQLPPDAALDFGGIGKGYLLDQLAAMVAPVRGLAGFWFSLGGDIIAGGRDPRDSPWRIGVQHAAEPSLRAGELTGPAGGQPFAVATSGITKRQGAGPGGHSWHHLIDPRTGRPAATDLLTVTVGAATATAADVLAKCAVVLGRAAAWPFLHQHGTTAAVLQAAGPANTVIITTHRGEARP